MLSIFSLFISLSVAPTHETDLIKSDLLEILEYYNEFEIVSFKEDINNILLLIEEFENSGNEELFLSINQKYKLVKYAHELSLDLSYESEQFKTTYFNEWNNITYLKKRVDNLYTYQASVGIAALGQDSEETRVRKKAIYAGYNLTFDQYMSKLKATNECDYRDKISLLKSLEPVLLKSEKLLTMDDTSNLEKELKKEEDVQVIEKAILAY